MLVDLKKTSVTHFDGFRCPTKTLAVWGWGSVPGVPALVFIDFHWCLVNFKLFANPYDGFRCPTEKITVLGLGGVPGVPGLGCIDVHVFRVILKCL